MSDAAVATPAKAAPKKKTASKPKVPAAHPTYKVMIVAAIGALKERSGSSRQAILKYIMANYKVGNNPIAINARVKTALKSAVKAGSIKQSKGVGATGSFRLEKVEKPKKAAGEKKPKKPAAKKAAAAAKKPAAAAKKTAAKKSPKKPAKKPAAKKPKKSPAKAKKPAAKKPKKSPAKAKKPAAKKPAAKKPAKK